MDKGTLVEFKVQSDRRLGVVDRPDGKSRWFVIDERGTTVSLTPRQVTYSVPGQTYKASEIPKFLKEVQPYLDPTSLEVAWELLIELGEESINPKQMANLLFSEENPPQCYAASNVFMVANTWSRTVIGRNFFGGDYQLNQYWARR